MKLCLDLCSGLGGFSQAFTEPLGWDVVTVDIERKFRPTIIADVSYLPFRSDLRPDVVLASPPCQCFSVAALRYYWNKKRPVSPKTVAAIRLVKSLLREIHRLAPHRWLMENPRGMLRTVIGRPAFSLYLSDFGTPWKKPTDFWGDVQLPIPRVHGPYDRVPRGGVPGLGIQGRVRNPALRAQLPFELSDAIRRVVS